MRKKLIAPLLAALLLAGCGPAPADPVPAASATVFAMDTVMDLKAYGGSEALLEEASGLIEGLEDKLSTTDPGSEICALNETGTARLSEDAADLLGRALELGWETDGALDVSIYPVVRAWGFTAEEYRVPGEAELQELLTRVDYGRISLGEDGTVTLPEGMKIDLGGVAKGYTGDLLARFLREKGITSAILNLGGNVQTLGTRPDGTPWRVAVQDPDGGEYLGVLDTADEAVITSGGYERYFEDEAGNLYWHIIDPSTGRPAQNGLISVTVVGREGVRCDGLSTALFVMGPQGAVEHWRAHRDFEMILVREDRSVLITPGLEGRFQLSDPSRSLEVIPDEN